VSTLQHMGSRRLFRVDELRGVYGRKCELDTPKGAFVRALIGPICPATLAQCGTLPPFTKLGTPGLTGGSLYCSLRRSLDNGRTTLRGQSPCRVMPA
jgi:hypothetical protein